MCLSTPKPPKLPPPPPEPPRMVDADVRSSGDKEKRRLRAASGHSGTILTGAGGAMNSPNVGKTLLGG
jgi:hypothetical protein